MSALEDPELIKPYEKLSRRAHLYRKYHIPAVESFLFGMGFIIVAGILENIGQLKLPEPRIIWILPFLLGIVLIAVLEKKASIFL